MKEQHQKRREYLAGKMLDGARALDDFFEELVTRRNANPEELHRTLADQYNLTHNQRAFFEKVATRASRAQGIVRYLENRFGVNDDGEFIDASGLYSLVHRTKKPLKNIRAETYSIGIGFFKNRWLHRSAIGFHKHATMNWDQLSVPLEQTLARLEGNKCTECESLTFKMPDFDYFHNIVQRQRRATNTQEGDLLSPLATISASMNQQKIETHEFRHVIDQILGLSLLNVEYSEYAATLYEDGKTSPEINVFASFQYDPIRGLKDDFKNFSNRMQNAIQFYTDRLLESEKYGPTSEIIEKKRESMKERLRRFET
jgi:hypothetical protein